MVAGFFSFVVSWGDYLIVSIISQSQRTATATLVIQRLSSALLIRWGQVAAAAVLTSVPTIILFSFVQKRLVEGLTAGAVKEWHAIYVKLGLNFKLGIPEMHFYERRYQVRRAMRLHIWDLINPNPLRKTQCLKSQIWCRHQRIRLWIRYHLS